MPSIAEARKNLPQLDHLNDQEFVSTIQRIYYPQMASADIASQLGVDMTPRQDFSKQPKGFARAAGDSAVALGSGVVSGVKMMSDVMGADNAVSQGLDSVNKGMQSLYSPQRQQQMAERDAIIKQAEKEGIGAEVKAYLGAFADAPFDTTLNALGTMFPTVVAAALSGGATAAAGLGARSAALAQKGIQYGIGAAQGVGSVKGQIYEEVDKRAQQEGKSPEEAAAIAAQAQAYSGQNADQIALGAGLGVLAGSGPVEKMAGLFGKKATQEGGKAAAKEAAEGFSGSWPTRMLKAAGAEAIPEGLQGGQERFASNLAQQREGYDQPLMQGVYGSAALEGVASAPLGAATGIRKPHVAPEIVPENGPMTRAANTAAAVTPPPEPPAPLSEEQTQQLLDHANERFRELEEKANGTKDQNITTPDGKKRTVRGKPKEFLTPEEKAERDFLAQNGGDAQALAKAYGFTPQQEAAALDALDRQAKTDGQLVRDFSSTPDKAPVVEATTPPADTIFGKTFKSQGAANKARKAYGDPSSIEVADNGDGTWVIRPVAGFESAGGQDATEQKQQSEQSSGAQQAAGADVRGGTVDGAAVPGDQGVATSVAPGPDQRSGGAADARPLEASADTGNAAAGLRPAGVGTGAQLTQDATQDKPAEDADGRLDAARTFAQANGSASINDIQKLLRVNYNTAASLLDKMQADGVLGESDASGRRPFVAKQDGAAPQEATTPPAAAPAKPATLKQPASQQWDAMTPEQRTEILLRPETGFRAAGSKKVQAARNQSWGKLGADKQKKIAAALAGMEQESQQQGQAPTKTDGTQANQAQQEQPSRAQEAAPATAVQPKDTPAVVSDAGATGIQADGVSTEPERIKVMTRFGQDVYVNKADLESDKPRMLHYTSTGKSLGVIVRDNLDPTGEVRAADAKEQAENPLFSVIGTKNGGVFASQGAARRELNTRGLSDSHEVVAANGGFVLKRKAEAKPEQPAAPAEASASQEVRRQEATDAKQRLESQWQRLMSDNPEAVASELTKDDAQAHLERLNAAPGDNAKARAVLEQAAKPEPIQSSLEWTEAQNNYTNRPVHRYAPDPRVHWATVQNPSNGVYVVEYRMGDKVVATEELGDKLTAVKFHVAAKVKELDAKQATHQDPGEKPEAATKAVVADSLKTAAKNEDAKPSEMRKWLLGEIDKALLQASDRAEFDQAVKDLGEKTAQEAYTGSGHLGKGGADDFVTFDVPGDGKYKVRNAMRNLLEFRKTVSTSPGFKDNGQKTLAPEENDGVQRGSGGKAAAVLNMIQEGDFEAARDYAQAQGVNLDDIKVPRGDMKPAWERFRKDGTLPPEPKQPSKEWEITQEQNPYKSNRMERVAKLTRVADGATYVATVTGPIDGGGATYVITKDGNEFSTMTTPRPFSEALVQAESGVPLANDKPAPSKASDTGWNMAGTGYAGKRYIGRNITLPDGTEVVARVYENAGVYEEAEVKVGGVRKFTVTDRENAQDKADAFIKTLMQAEPAPLSESEITTRGQLVADYVQKIIDGQDHPSSLRVGVISTEAAGRLAEATNLEPVGSVEVVIADSVVHAGKRHPDLTLDDWVRLPEVTNGFDVAALGREGRDGNMTRIVLRKQISQDGSGYGVVYDFASGGAKGRKRLNLVTYFWGTESALNAWWDKNKGADPVAVPNSPEPVSSTHDGVSAPSERSVARPPEGDNTDADKLATPEKMTPRQFDAWIRERVTKQTEQFKGDRNHGGGDEGVGYIHLSGEIEKGGTNWAGTATGPRDKRDTRLIFRADDGKIVWYDDASQQVYEVAKDDPRLEITRVEPKPKQASNPQEVTVTADGSDYTVTFDEPLASISDQAFEDNLYEYGVPGVAKAEFRKAREQAKSGKSPAGKPSLSAEQRKTLDESLLAGSISVEDYMKATGLTDEDVGTFGDNLRTKADQKAQAESPYFQAVNKIRETLAEQMKVAMDAPSSTPQQRNSKQERMARIDRERDTLNMLAAKFEHPFDNSYVSKLSPILKNRHNKQFTGIALGDKAKTEYRDASYRNWAELLIEAASQKAGVPVQGAKTPKETPSADRPDIAAIRRDATLDKQTSENGEVMTRRQWVERKVADGLKPTIKQKDRIQPMSRMAYFRATNEEQRAHERKIKAAGKKDVYWIGDYEVTKTEHDYALSLLASAAKQPQQVNAAPTTAEPKQTDGTVADNFGEKLPPARRAMAAKLNEELSNDDIAKRPLSEIWPLAENEAIEEPFAAAVAHAARAEIPAKPRQPYKVKQWVETVRGLRELAGKLLRGGVTRETFIEMAQANPRLRDWMSKVLLLEQMARSEWSRIGAVEERPDAQVVVGGEFIKKPMLRIQVDGKSHWLYGGQGATGDFAATVKGNMAGIMVLLDKAQPEKRMEFEVRQERSGARKVFINKKGDSQYRRLMEFDSVPEARKAITEQYDALVAAWEGVKQRDNITERDLRSAENRERSGKDWRGGKDVTVEQFQEQFGFKGGEFGKWVQQGAGDKERQAMLNNAYDALMDLAQIVGVPPKAMSLNGTLGIAFGSRGSGWASAHFEPSNLVINLTKTRGAGALAHEWFHALDNYFSRLRGGEVPFNGDNSAYRANNYITHGPEPLMVRKGGKSYRPAMTRGKLEAMHEARKHLTNEYAPENWEPDPKHRQGVRPEVERRFADLVQALNESPMTKRADLLDKGKSGGYWSQTLERAARAFESYVIAKMHDEGYHNDFLVNVRNLDEVGKSSERYPYLMAGELKPIADAFDALLGEFQTKTDDAGNVAMFSRSYGSNRNSVAMKDAAAAVGIIRSQMPGAPEIVLVDKIEDAPAALYRQIVDAGAEFTVEAAWHDGRIYAFPENVANIDRFMFVVGRHEVRHAGFSAILGERKNEVLLSIARANRSVMMEAKERQREGLDKSLVDSVEEVLADTPVEALSKLTRVGALVAAVRRWLRETAVKLRKAGLKRLADAIEPRTWTDNDVLAFVMKAEDISRGPGGGGGGGKDTSMSQATPRYVRLIEGISSGNRTYSQEPVDLGRTPAVLRMLGASDLALTIKPETILKAMRGEDGSGSTAHNLSADVMLALPNLLNEPVLVLRSKTQNDSFLVVTELSDRLGKSVVAAVHLSVRQGRAEVNRVASSYGRNVSQLQRALDDGDTLYVDMKKAPSWSTTVRLQLPWVVQSSEGAEQKFKTNSDLAQFLANDTSMSRAFQKNEGNSRIANTSKERFRRTEALRQAVADLQDGKITRAEYNAMVDDLRPVFPYEQVPTLTTPEQARYALGTGKGSSATKAAAYGQAQKTLKAGETAQLRLDIPAFEHNGTWVVTVHTPDSQNPNAVSHYEGGKVAGYESVASLTDVRFGMNQNTALKIATGGQGKDTLATAVGKWKPITPQQAQAKAESVLRDPAWVQVGMDPFRHSYFYDRDSMQPVLQADEVLQIGPLVLAKNPTYGSDADVMGKTIKFSRARVPVNAAQAQTLVRNTLADYMGDAGAKVSWWDKTVGTQYAKAQKLPAFKKVFDHTQDFIRDTSHLANEAADLARGILPRMDSFNDVKRAILDRKNFTISAEDSEAIAGPIFTGTLNDKKVYSADELSAQFGLSDEQIGLYLAFMNATHESLGQVVASDVVRMLGEGATPELKADAVKNRAAFRDSVSAMLADKVAQTDGELAAARREAKNAMARFYAWQKKKLEGTKPGSRLSVEQEIEDHKQEVQAANRTTVGKAERAYDEAVQTERSVRTKYERLDQLIEEGYAPLMRFGKYVVHIKDKQGQTLFWSLYESKAAANQAARELGTDPEFAQASIEQGVLSQKQYELFAAMPLDSLEMFAKSLEADQSEVYQDFIKLAKNNRSVLKRLLKRKGTAGFSEDVPRVLASFITSNARAASGSIHLPAAKEAARTIRQGDVQDEAIALIDATQKPGDASGWVRGLMFANFIGGSIASAVVNLTQPVTMTLPYLAQFGGGTLAGKRMMAAGKMVATGKVADAQLAQALKRAETDGIVSPQEIHHLSSQASGAWGNNVLLKTFNYLWAAPFSLAEQFNRRVTFLAAYQTAQEQGMSDPYRFAEQAVTETQGLYNKANVPNWARTPLGATALTFKQFSIHYLEWMGRMYRSGPEGKKAVLLALALLMVAAGTDGLPFMEDIDDLVDTLGQALGYDANFKRARRNFVANTLGFGDVTADVLARGITAVPGVPLDASMRMGMGNLIPGTGLMLRSQTDKAGQVLEALGPGGALVKQYMGAGEKLLAGKPVDAAVAAAPLAFQNAAKGAGMWMTGEARDTRDRKVMNVDGVDAAMKFIGFQPQALAHESQKMGMIRRSEQLAKNVEGEIVGDWARALVDKDQAAVQAAQQALREWNQNNPESPIKITPQQIRHRALQLRQTREQRFITSTSPERRAQVRQAMQQP